MNVNENDGNDLILALAQELKKNPDCKMPDWAMFVKTGVNKTRPPMNNDWWYIRAASILRKVAIIGPIGTNKLKRKFGGKYRRGYKPSIFVKGSGKIIRVILQQLEKAGLIKQTVISGHKGRVLDVKGTALIASVAKTIRVVPAKEAPKAEAKPKKAAKAPKEEAKEAPKEEAPKEAAKPVAAEE